MDILTIVLVWILLSFPIVKHVNDRLEEKGDDVRFKIGFQILLFIRAQFEVPKWYLIKFLNFLK